MRGEAPVSRRPLDRPERLADVLRHALERLPVARRIADHAVWTHWNAVVGATLALHARPHRLRNGILFVAVDSPEWMQELQFLKYELRDRLNARLGRDAIRDVFVGLETGE